ncbi:MAG: glutamyl-tRNA reductase [Campylobacterota bacterium]|nr:glutamyl-tRNA reductase [Campylobacterota bacterium]
MEYIVISFTHKNTDISTREKLAFNNEVEKEAFLKNILLDVCINEAILLSTCNRIELILSASCTKEAGKAAIAEFSGHSTLNLDELLSRADIYENEGAIHHIFTVASSLDSLVVGETQIAGQLKDAFKFSIEKNYSSQKLSRVLHYAFKCAARVRNATQLGSGSVSVASTAVSQAKQLYKDTTEVKALVIGAGEMSELACRHLLKYGFNVVICSRNIKKARVLAHSILSDGNGDEYNAEQIEIKPYEDLENLLNSMRLMITATAAPYPIIKKEMIKEFKHTRHWFDIALPRDIEEMDTKNLNLNIYSVDDLQCIVDENMELRASQAKEAYSIVGKMTIEFFSWLKTLSVEPVIKDLHLKGDMIIDKKVKNAIKKHFIKCEDEENITKLCQTIMSEFLHQPTVKLRDVSKSMDGDVVLGTTQNLFGLKEENI